MGGGASYSRDISASFRNAATSAGYTDAFRHTADISAGRTSAKVHETLDPAKLKNGVRESRDLDDRPNSRAIAVCLDVTGSMSQVPTTVVDKIPGLLGAIVKNGALPNPQVLFSAVGDAYCDRAPFQVGQFESSNAIESDLSNFYLEGGGGGNGWESYDLFMYFLARCTATDCFEKRGERGYAFLIQDEPVPPFLLKKDVKAVFGQDIQENIPFKDIIAEAQEKWDIFILRPQSLSLGKSEGITKQWEALFPDRVFPVQDPSGICETISMLIALEEGVDLDAVADTLMAEGSSKDIVLYAKSAVTKGGSLVKKGSVDGDLDLGTGKAKRV